MKRVKWKVDCETTVNVENDEDALEEVRQLFENKLWGETGQCGSTFEQMSLLGVEDIKPGFYGVTDLGEHGIKAEWIDRIQEGL
jgi:hypothetical protein